MGTLSVSIGNNWTLMLLFCNYYPFDMQSELKYANGRSKCYFSIFTDIFLTAKCCRITCTTAWDRFLTDCDVMWCCEFQGHLSIRRDHGCTLFCTVFLSSRALAGSLCNHVIKMSSVSRKKSKAKQQRQHQKCEKVNLLWQICVVVLFCQEAFDTLCDSNTLNEAGWHDIPGHICIRRFSHCKV